MAKGAYIGVAGKARKVKKMYIGVNNVARKVKKGYIGINGVARQCFLGGTPLSTKAVGSTVQIRENGSLVNYYVAKHDYESGLNGPGRTLLVRQTPFTARETNVVWDADKKTNYAASDIDQWLNSTCKAKYSQAIQNAMATTSFYYLPSPASSPSPLNRSVFILSVAEFGFYTDVGDGSPLEIGATLAAPDTSQWTRTPQSASLSSPRIYGVGDGRVFVQTPSGSLMYTTPVFTLPGDFPLEEISL